jgi:hypothetical protein
MKKKVFENKQATGHATLEDEIEFMRMENKEIARVRKKKLELACERAEMVR